MQNPAKLILFASDVSSSPAGCIRPTRISARSRTAIRQTATVKGMAKRPGTQPKQGRKTVVKLDARLAHPSHFSNSPR
jgi:hypothetical protein